jgi:hypothetical protein
MNANSDFMWHSMRHNIGLEHMIVANELPFLISLELCADLAEYARGWAACHGGGGLCQGSSLAILQRGIRVPWLVLILNWGGGGLTFCSSGSCSGSGSRTLLIQFKFVHRMLVTVNIIIIRRL